MGLTFLILTPKKSYSLDLHLRTSRVKSPQQPRSPPGIAISGNFDHIYSTLIGHLLTGCAMYIRTAKFQIGQIVKHRVHPFRGVIFDVDPEFANSEEWWQSIPVENRPPKEQPYYHLLAENAQGPYIAYVSEQNLVSEKNPDPVSHPEIDTFFEGLRDDLYITRPRVAN
jgi:heat shock protein HspQ